MGYFVYFKMNLVFHQEVGYLLASVKLSTLLIYLFISTYCTSNALVNVCCVPGCKTGNKCTETSHQSSETIPLFKFAVNPILKKKWINAVSRHDWTVLPNHHVCAKHFGESDLIKTSTD